MSGLSVEDPWQIAELVDRFGATWRRADRPRIEDWIDRLPDRLRAMVALQLVAAETNPVIAMPEKAG
jgi:hypothetical protein